jgi:hypothetical protein
MSVLMLAFYGEGNSDREFLPPLIQRTSKAILDDYADRIVELWDSTTITKKSGSQSNVILEAAREAGERHALLVHNDADTRGYWKTREELFEPGKTLVQTVSGGPVKISYLPFPCARERPGYWQISKPLAMFQE